MGDFRRQRAASPRQQGQFGSKVLNAMTTRRGREEWDAGRRDNGAPRSMPGVRRGRTGWDTGSVRAGSPAAKDRRQDGAESDDDIAAKPRPHQGAQPSIANTAGASRAPPVTQPVSHSGSGSSFFKSGAGAPPPDLVRKGYDPDIDMPAPPPTKPAKPNGFDVFSVRHTAQENVSGAASRPRTRQPVLDTQLSPAVQALSQHRPATPPVPAVPSSAVPMKQQAAEFTRDPPTGNASDTSLAVSQLSDKITTVQSSMATFTKDVENLHTTTTNHSSLIAALQKRMTSVSQQAESISGKFAQLEAAHGERLSAVEAARLSIEADLRSVPRASPADAATEACTQEQETVGDTQVQGLPADTYVKSERNGRTETARGAERSGMWDSRVGDGAPAALIDVTPTSPTLQAHPSSPADTKPSPAALNGSHHGGAAAPDPQSQMVDAPWPKRTATLTSDSEASSSIVRIMRAFQDKLLDMEQRCTQLAAKLSSRPADGAAALDTAAVESAAAAVLSAREALAEQKEAQGSHERRMKRFVQDMERMTRTLQDQLMGIDHYMQLQTSRVDQVAGDCLHHRQLLQQLESARCAAQAQQEELGKKVSEMSAAVTKLQHQQHSLTIQVQKAEAERLKELRRAQEASRAAAAAPTAPSAQASAEVRASEAAAAAAAAKEVRTLREENAALKGRIAALEAMVTGDKLAELVRGAMRAEAAADAKPDASEGRGRSAAKSTGKGSTRGGKVSPTEASEAASDSEGDPSQDGTGTGGDASAEEAEPPRKTAAKQGKKKRRRTTDTDDGQEPVAAEKKKPGKRTRQGTRGTK